MKKIRYSILLLFVFLFADSYGMKKRPYSSASSSSALETVSVQAQFVPQDNITGSLFSLLNSARRQVLIAMYWITDDFIVNKLLELKRRGIDIKIIMDESSPNLLIFINKLLNQNITPIIFPSETKGIGKMHNKFIIIDDEAVFTGSANFTQYAFKPTSQIFNYENVIIMHAVDIAQQYQTNFRNIERAAFEIYIGTIADNDRNQIPAWMNRLLPILYRDDNRLSQMQQFTMARFNSTQQDRIRSFFGLQVAAQPAAPQIEPATQAQAALLRLKGVSPEGMSKQEAGRRIGAIIAEEKRQR